MQLTDKSDNIGDPVNLIQDFLASYALDRKLADSSIVEYQRCLNSFTQYISGLGIQSMQHISKAQVLSYLNHLEQKGYASSTRRRQLIVIRALCNRLYESKRIQGNPVQDIPLPERMDLPPQILSEREESQLRLAARTPRDIAIITLMLATGITLAECVRLQLTDVHPTVGNQLIIRVRGKRDQRRDLALDKEASRTLRHWLAERPEVPEHALFLSDRGRPISWRGLQYVIKKLYNEAEITHGTATTFRSTFATEIAKQDIPNETLRHILGLNSAESVARYKSNGSHIR